MMFPVQHRVEVYEPETEVLLDTLGKFETATEARTACAAHACTVLSWQQPWVGIWNAQGEHSWYRVVSELE
jgi:hypothetical protein